LTSFGEEDMREMGFSGTIEDLVYPGKNIEIPEADQKRIVTAQDARINGADYVVVGRAISRAKDPIAVVESMQSEIRKGLAS